MLMPIPMPVVSKAGVSVAIIDATVQAGTGAQSFTNANLGGLTPVAAIAFMGPPGTNNGTLNVGVCDASLNQYGVSSAELDGQSTSNSRHNQYTDFIRQYNASAYEPTDKRLAGVVTAFVPNGLTINWTTNAGDQKNIRILLICGCQAAVGAVTPASAINGTATVSGLAFQPKGILAISTGNATFRVIDDLSLSFGACDASLNQGCVSIRSADDRTTTKVTASCSSGLLMRSNRTDEQVEVTAINSDGFTITTRNNNDPDIQYYLALDCECGVSVDQITSLGSQNISVGGAFTAKAVIAMCSSADSINTIEDAPPQSEGIGIGFATKDPADNIVNVSDSMISDDESGTTDSKNFASSTVAYKVHSSSSSFEAPVTAFGSAQVTIVPTAEFNSYCVSFIIGD